jgi:alkanesulfonate monooxygenase SsuD/methylene tetrahydromethanopterin reductase-like flavin-dependent oxidoreductase (luciferase family)
MSDKLIGVAGGGANAPGALGRIERSEQAGIPVVWMTTGGTRPDSLTTFAAAAVRTQNIKFGTSIVPAFPCHPLVMVQQVQVSTQ